MKIKKYLIVLLILLTFAVCNIVQAAPNSIFVSSDGNVGNKNEIVHKTTNVDGNQHEVYCINGMHYRAPIGMTCTLNDGLLTSDQRIFLAYIINAGVLYSDKDYATMQYGSGENYGSDITNLIDMVQNQNSAAIANSKAIYNSGDLILKLSSSTLTFTKSGDKFVSNSFTVSGNYLASSSATITSGEGAKVIIESDNKYHVEVPLTALNSSGSMNVSVKVDGKQQAYMISHTYDCPATAADGHVVQDLVGFPENESRSNSTSISGTITTPKVVVKKYDKDGETLLSGVKLRVEDKDGNVVNLNGTSLEWITEDKEYQIVGLPEGTYYLVEVETLSGYDLSQEKIEFVVDYENSETINVEMQNKLTETEISKVNATNGKELPGATLQILDSEGKVLTFCLDKDGKEVKECKWVSTDKPFIVKGLAVGKYKLKEIVAPEGFALKETVVEFEVKGDGSITKVKMENELEVEVPDTLSARSTLLLCIAMFDIALGIGIITYVKQNKIEE